MSSKDYYPAGAANDTNAPYNERKPPDKAFDMWVSQTLSKNTSISTDNYSLYRDEEDGYLRYDTSNINWEEEYHENNHLLPSQLIERFKQFLTTYLPDPVVNMKGYKNFKYLIKECENWVEDEVTYMEDT